MEVSVPSQRSERSCVCALWVLIYFLGLYMYECSTGFGTNPTVWELTRQCDMIDCSCYLFMRLYISLNYPEEMSF
jgi:hypothetical protein